jgi:hypothetical protein
VLRANLIHTLLLFADELNVRLKWDLVFGITAGAVCATPPGCWDYVSPRTKPLNLGPRTTQAGPKGAGGTVVLALRRRMAAARLCAWTAFSKTLDRRTASHFAAGGGNGQANLQINDLTSDSPFSRVGLFCALLTQNGANVCAIQRPSAGGNRCVAERIGANFRVRFADPAPILVSLPSSHLI